MPNLGEELCGEYLRHLKKCQFVTYNVTNPDIQGEIDVIAINLDKKVLYVCEVAVHTRGLQYVKNSRPDDYDRFVSELEKDITYAERYFKGYQIIPMIWSPIVKISLGKAKYDTLNELHRVVEHVREKYRLEVELIINHKFSQAMDELKEVAGSETSEFKSNVMRMFQIEKTLEKHLQILSTRNNGNHNSARN